MSGKDSVGKDTGRELTEKEMDLVFGGFSPEGGAWDGNEFCADSPDGKHEWLQQRVGRSRLATHYCKYCYKTDNLFY